VSKAPDPEWHYVLVSLRDDEAVVRSYRIVGEVVTEEDLVLCDGGAVEVTEAQTGPDG